MSSPESQRGLLSLRGKILLKELNCWVHAYNLSTQKAKTRIFEVPGHPGQHKETVPWGAGGVGANIMVHICKPNISKIKTKGSVLACTL